MDENRFSFLLTTDDIDRIKRDGTERNKIRNDVFCNLLKNLGYKFYRCEENSKGVDGVYNLDTTESENFENEDEYIDWLEAKRKMLKPWVDGLADEIIKSNRNLVFLIDFSRSRFKKLYSATSKKEWDKSKLSAESVIMDICEEHVDELRDGQWLYIADRESDMYKPKYRAYYVSESGREDMAAGMFSISKVNDEEAIWFNEKVNQK